MKKIIPIIAVLIILNIYIVAAVSIEGISVSSTDVLPGDSVELLIKLKNDRAYASLNGNIVIDLVSLESTYETVITESVYSGISLKAREEIEHKFSFAIDSCLSQGKYRLYVYYKDYGESNVGKFTTIQAPEFVDINVGYKMQEYRPSDIEINSLESRFCIETGCFDNLDLIERMPLFEKNKPAGLELHLYNAADQVSRDLRAAIDIYKWDDLKEERKWWTNLKSGYEPREFYEVSKKNSRNFIENYNEKIGYINAGSSKIVSIPFASPAEPGEYIALVNIYEENSFDINTDTGCGRFSIAQLRIKFRVEGTSSKIAEVAPMHISADTNQKNGLYVKVDSTGKQSMKLNIDVTSGGESIYSNSEIISVDSVFVKEYAFMPKVFANAYIINAEILDSEDDVLDTYEVNVNPERFVTGRQIIKPGEKASVQINLVFLGILLLLVIGGIISIIVISKKKSVKK